MFLKVNVEIQLQDHENNQVDINFIDERLDEEIQGIVYYQSSIVSEIKKEYKINLALLFIGVWILIILKFCGIGLLIYQRANIQFWGSNAFLLSISILFSLLSLIYRKSPIIGCGHDDCSHEQD